MMHEPGIAFHFYIGGKKKLTFNPDANEIIMKRFISTFGILMIVLLHSIIQAQLRDYKNLK